MDGSWIVDDAGRHHVLRAHADFFPAAVLTAAVVTAAIVTAAVTVGRRRTSFSVAAPPTRDRHPS